MDRLGLLRRGGQFVAWTAWAAWMRWLARTGEEFGARNIKNLVLGGLMAAVGACFAGAMGQRMGQLPEAWNRVEAMRLAGQGGTPAYEALARMYFVVEPGMIAFLSIVALAMLVWGASLVMVFKKDSVALRERGRLAEGLARAAWERGEIAREVGRGAPCVKRRPRL